MLCQNCNKEIEPVYCPVCGHPAALRRIDGRYILHEIAQVLNFERGILYSIRELSIHPGVSIRSYLTENRNRLVKPIFFIIVTSLFYTLCNHYFHFEDGYVKYLDPNATTTSVIFKWVQANYGYANIIMGAFIAVWIKLFFYKSDHNLYEILILLCYVMGMGMLIYSIFGILQGITGSQWMQVAGVAGFVYTTWSIGQFYGKRKVSTYIKAFFAYLLGMVTFSVVALLTGTLIDIMTKH